MKSCHHYAGCGTRTIHPERDTGRHPNRQTGCGVPRRKDLPCGSSLPIRLSYPHTCRFHPASIADAIHICIAYAIECRIEYWPEYEYECGMTIRDHMTIHAECAMMAMPYPHAIANDTKMDKKMATHFGWPSYIRLRFWHPSTHRSAGFRIRNPEIRFRDIPGHREAFCLPGK
jgi:hypothetical protein